ncbi:MAG: GIY-YIG nuclease family protein [Anaerolineales bacterium]|jgi:putative endonuclease
MSFYCYILECVDGTYYTGWTTDPQRRLRQHNAGRGARYTSTRRPVRLAYVEPQPDRSSAQKREIKIKKLTRTQKQALIQNTQIGD